MTAAAETEAPDRFESLESVAEALRQFHHEVLCSEVIEHLSPLAEQHTLLALTALETARHYWTLAALHETRELARFQLGTR